MARETKRHSGATRDEVKVVAGVNINYDPYVQLEFYSYRIKALEESLETHKFLLAMHGGDLDEENATASIFLNAVQEGL